MQVKDHILYTDDDKMINFVETPNRSGPIRQLYLIMHYTGNTSLSGTINWLSNKQAKASAHIIIGRNGKVVQMVRLDKKAWHAGKSTWGKLNSMNSYSIGIELVNAGKLTRREDGEWITWAGETIPEHEVSLAIHKNESRETGWHIYPERQIKAAIDVAKALNDTYRFIDIIGHDDVSPTRKSDPGPAFSLNSFSSLIKGRNV